MAPIFIGSDDVGVGVAVAAAVAVGVGDTVGVTVGVAVSTGVDVAIGVGAGVFSLPQDANIGTIRTKARARAINLYQKLPFGHMVNHLLLQIRLVLAFINQRNMLWDAWDVYPPYALTRLIIVLGTSYE